MFWSFVYARERVLKGGKFVYILEDARSGLEH